MRILGFYKKSDDNENLLMLTVQVKEMEKKLQNLYDEVLKIKERIRDFTASK